MEYRNLTEEYFAHSKEGRPQSEWQKLEDHLKNVAALAILLTTI
jgi:hypothetical protein